jgi:hypothetical protein
MFGGPPIMSSPAFVQPFPAQVYPAPRYIGQGVNPPAAPPVWNEPVAAGPPYGQGPSRDPVARGRAEDEPSPTLAPRAPVQLREPEPLDEVARPPLKLPAPEDLGLGSAARASVDWADVHNRLDRLGALSFYQQKLAGGGYRVTFLLLAGKADRVRQIEAEADSVAAAVTLALDRAEKGVVLK